MYLIRHGETEWNRDHILMGHSDSPLTEKGIEQANELAVHLQKIDFSAVYSSDSLRAIRTASIVGGVDLSRIHKSVRLRERHFAQFEGMSVLGYQEANKESFLERDRLPEAKRWNFEIAECVESDASLVTRVISELFRISSEHLGKEVLVSTHGGPIRMFLMRLGYAPYGSLPGGSFKNCGYLVVESDGVELSVKEVNGLRHR